MKNLINEEIKRIKQIMLLKESSPPGGLIGALADASGFFDNLIPKVRNYYDNLSTAEQTRFIGDIRRLASGAGVPNPNSLNIQGLIKGISNTADDAAKINLLKYLNTSDNEIAKNTLQLIKNDSTLLANASEIEKSVLATELNAIGLGNYVNDITMSLIKKPWELADMFADWKVKWGETGALRGEYVNALENLNVNQAFKSKYSQLLNDESWMTNTIKNLSNSIPTKTPDEASAYIESELAKYLQQKMELAKTKEEVSKIKQYRDFIFQRKNWADKNYPLYKKSLGTVLAFWVGALLPASAILETGSYLLRDNKEFEKAFAKSEEGKDAISRLEKNEISTEEFQKLFLSFSRVNLAKDIGSTSMVVPKIISLIGSGVVSSVAPTEKTSEDFSKEGQDLYNRIKKLNNQKDSISPTNQEEPSLTGDDDQL